MLPADRRRLFEPAFATFKAFDNLTVASCSWEQLAFHTSIWQILQHLLAWQAHQLSQLPGTLPPEAFDEKRSWDVDRVPSGEAALQAAVTQFNRQLADLQTWVDAAEGDAPQVLL